MAVVASQSFTDSSRAGVVERHVQCALSPMHHFAESAASSGISRFQFSRTWD